MGKFSNYEDVLIQTLFTHLQFMGYQNLHDRFGFGNRRLKRFYECLEREFENYSQEKLKTEELLVYCQNKENDIYKWVRSLSQSQKLKVSGFKAKKGTSINFMKVVDSAYLIYGGLASYVLFEDFKFSKPQVKKFLEEMAYYLDSYAKGYLDDNLVNELMIEECKIDVINNIDYAKKENE